MSDSLFQRFFRDPAVVTPERPAAKPLYRELFPPIAEPVARDIVQSPFVRRALEGKLPAKEVRS